MGESVCGSHLEVVKDVADERDEANPLLQRAFPRLLALLELLLQAVQQVPPEHGSVVLFGLSLEK